MTHPGIGRTSSKAYLPDLTISELTWWTPTTSSSNGMSSNSTCRDGKSNCFPAPRTKRSRHFHGDKLGTTLPVQTRPAYNASDGLICFNPHRFQGLQRIIDV